MIRMNKDGASLLLALLLALGSFSVYAQDQEPTPIPVEPCDSVRAKAGNKQAEAPVVPPDQTEPSSPSQPSGPSIPIFASSAVAAPAAQELAATRRRFREHWRSGPTSNDILDRINWDGERNRRLIYMIVAEERLAWDAAGGYSHEERAMLADPYSAMRRVHLALFEMARKNKEIDRLLADMATFEQQHNRMMQGISEGPHWSGGGRAGYLEIAFVRIAHSKIIDRINVLNLEMGAKEQRLVRELQRVNGTLDKVTRSRRERGVQKIRQIACRQALARGQGEPEPFYVHRPEGSVRQNAVANLLREMLAERLGRLSSQVLIGDPDTILDSDPRFIRVFDSDERERFLASDD